MDAPLYVTTFAFVMNKDKYTRCRPPEKGDRRQLQHGSPGRVGEPWQVRGRRHRQDKALPITKSTN